MVRTSQTGNNTTTNNKVGAFSMATLIMWVVSVWFEILFNKRKELLWVVAGGCLYQIANWVIHYWVSRDSLFVNSSVFSSTRSLPPPQRSRIYFGKSVFEDWPGEDV